MKELSLFTGMGGGIYGSLILKWKTVAYVEKDAYCQKVIKQRQQDGRFDKGEIFGDITKFNQESAANYRGKIDIITGGFPCQPFSVAGKRKGTSDDRWLLAEIIKTIKIIQPRWLFFENVPGILTSNAIIKIYQSLNRLGYQCQPPLVLGSADCGNIHKRERVWIYACNTESESIDGSKLEFAEYSQQQKSEPGNTDQSVYDTNNWCNRVQRNKQKKVPGKPTLQRSQSIRGLEGLLSRSDIPQPLFRGVDDELPDWRKQLKAIGNGQDPIVMATAWNLLSGLP